MNLEDLWKQNENTSGEITDLLKNSRWKKGGDAYPLKKIKKNLLYSMPIAVVTTRTSLAPSDKSTTSQRLNSGGSAQ